MPYNLISAIGPLFLDQLFVRGKSSRVLLGRGQGERAESVTPAAPQGQLPTNVMGMFSEGPRG